MIFIETRKIEIFIEKNRIFIEKIIKKIVEKIIKILPESLSADF